MHLSEWPKSKTLITPSADKDVEQQKLSFKSGTATLEGRLAVSYKYTLSIYHPAIVFLGIYPNELKIYVHTKTCTWMLIAALFIIVKTWKHQDVLQ